MPYTIEFVESGSGIVFRGSGVLTEDELVEIRRGLTSDAEAMHLFAFVLIDLERVVELRLNREGVRRLVALDERLAQLVPDMVVAVIAPSDHMFGIARMWETDAEGTGWTIQVVRSRSEVESWLARALAVRANQRAGLKQELTQHPRTLRKPFAATVVITDVVSERQISSRTNDLSVNGCFVTTPTPFNKGATIQLAIAHAGVKS